ncbi:amidohydrolase [Temperatibacter marinus]|uniref:Amidohydrolase n=1 Tax=Temperatibacter marinus TaxID=1456591 RepID=A0AA52EIZ5_9PROT|nr:amidohydrolase [Temperatibacter marinus]WND03670.1 amidohydrolase [Temperatibacter marinus]
MRNLLLSTVVTAGLLLNPVQAADSVKDAVSKDYNEYLKELFVHFHKNPELSLIENKTAARMAKELGAAGFEVHESVGVPVDGFKPTGIVAIMKNGDGPLVMMRADMDGLPVQEKSGLDYASKATQNSPITGKEVPVMHACGHDVHITSMVGTARHMAANKDKWSGTLMLIVQPAEERVLGAKAMMDANIWSRFGQPDYGLAFHVTSTGELGKVNVLAGAPYAGVDSVDIIIHGVGAHGASPHSGKDPIVLGSQIVLGLQTLVSRELSPRQPGVVTVGSFHSGLKHNIISDRAVLQLTVRNTNEETRKLLLAGIKRIAENMGRVAGLPEDKLPEVKVSKEWSPPMVNDDDLANHLKALWQDKMGEERVVSIPPTGMGAEDFPFFVIQPKLKSVYWAVGGTPKSEMDAAANGGDPIPSHHSPIFKVHPDSVKVGVESTVHALMDLMSKK